MANQSALNTTAHNLTNVNTPGYVRQQVLMKDGTYQTIGQNNTSLFQIGMGADVQGIRQVRDQFLDLAFRGESGRSGFYSAQSASISEIENILGETEGEAFSKVLNNLWESMNELSKHPEGLETRGSFVQNASLFVEKSNLMMKQLNGYQSNLNTEISNTVSKINQIGNDINDLNALIVSKEGAGGNANDYRDSRNTLIDELSSLVDIRVREDLQGNALISVENVPFVTISNVNELGVAQAEEFSQLVDPIWPHLSQEGPPVVNHKVFNFENPIGPQYDNNKGELKGLILSRGARTANYTDLASQTVFENDVEPSTIMTVQAQFDNLVHGVVTMINNTLSPTVGPPGARTMDPNAPYGLNGEQGIELFTRKYMDRYDSGGVLNEEDTTNEFSLYSAGNIEINPDILVDYNKLTISMNQGVAGDSTIIENILAKWQEPFSTLEPGSSGILNFTDYYNGFVADIGSKGNGINNQVANQETLTVQIDNQRNQLMGVSTDEELGNMIRFQHAYNASARVVTVVDQMIDKLINQTGLVGR
jgi:flagellar hook-associated protein 1 FlgK